MKLCCAIDNLDMLDWTTVWMRLVFVISAWDVVNYMNIMRRRGWLQVLSPQVMTGICLSMVTIVFTDINDYISTFPWAFIRIRMKHQELFHLIFSILSTLIYRQRFGQELPPIISIYYLEYIPFTLRTILPFTSIRCITDNRSTIHHFDKQSLGSDIILSYGLY